MMRKIKIASSKSQTMRSLLFASLAIGKSEIYGLLNSSDTDAMLIGLKDAGVGITQAANSVQIKGLYGEKLSVDGLKVDAGNSGQVLRFLGGILALFKGKYLLTGDYSIQNN